MSFETSSYLDEKARNSQVMKDLSIKVEKKLEEKKNKHKKTLDFLREKIVKEKQILESAPTYRVQRIIDTFEGMPARIQTISEAYEKKKKDLKDHFEERLAKIRAEWKEKEDSLFNEYEGEYGKLTVINREKERITKKLEKEKGQKSKTLIAVEHDYKKALQDYFDEFHEKPSYYFNFLESNDLPKDDLEEEKPEVIEEVDPKIAAIQKMEEENAILRQQYQDRLKEQERREQEPSSGSNARYGFVLPPTTEQQPFDSKEEEEDEESDTVSYDEEEALADYKRKMDEMRKAPKPMIQNISAPEKKKEEMNHIENIAIPLPLAKPKKVSIISKIIKPGVRTYKNDEE